MAVAGAALTLRESKTLSPCSKALEMAAQYMKAAPMLASEVVSRAFSARTTSRCLWGGLSEATSSMMVLNWDWLKFCSVQT